MCPRTTPAIRYAHRRNASLTGPLLGLIALVTIMAVCETTGLTARNARPVTISQVGE